jgi:hypothetical protein
MPEYILTEGDLRRALDRMEHRRMVSGLPQCLHLHIQVQDPFFWAEGRITVLTHEMIESMRKKGQIDLEEYHG